MNFKNHRGQTYCKVIAIIYIYNTQKGRKQESEGRRGGGRNEGRKKGKAGGKNRNIKIYKIQIQAKERELS